jgi:uncharacterized protein YndB with AHSA1/START domain
MTTTDATASGNPTLRDLVVRRHIAAPSAAVWRALTEGRQVMKWWGPEQFTSPSARMAVRERETSVVCMRSPEGQDMYSAWHYTRVVPGERLEYTFDLCTADGAELDPASLGLPPGFPRAVPHVITLEARGDETELTVVERGYGPGPFYELSKSGLEQCLDKLERLLASEKEAT